MKTMFVVGTRPEAIKLAPVIKYFQRKGENIVVCDTGQHKQMLEQTFKSFDIKPDIQLKTMQSGQSLNQLASRLLSELDQIIETTKPSHILVQGDTTSALCGGLAGFHREVEICHLEAGLRTHNMRSPFPEEANRTLLARITKTHFAPTKRAQIELIKEGTRQSDIKIVGNTVVDSIDLISKSWDKSLPLACADVSLDVPTVLVTCHRRENFGSILDGICVALKRLCMKYKDFQFVFPVHLNPAVKETIYEKLSGIENLKLLKPLDYPSMLYLISKSRLVISDSGGIQEEAPSFGVPVVVMRNHTERIEGVEAGFAELAGQDPDAIFSAASKWLDNPEKADNLLQNKNPYGDGNASARVWAQLTGNSFEEFAG